MTKLREDTGWTATRTAPDRLRWARSKSDFTQESFADSVGMKRGAYRKYEGGETPLKHEQAVKFARKLKLRWEWLLSGSGLPWLGVADELVELVESARPEEQQRILAVIRAMRTGTGE